jgi:hypothetical protein
MLNSHFGCLLEDFAITKARRSLVIFSGAVSTLLSPFEYYFASVLFPFSVKGTRRVLEFNVLRTFLILLARNSKVHNLYL